MGDRSVFATRGVCNGRKRSCCDYRDTYNQHRPDDFGYCAGPGKIVEPRTAETQPSRSAERTVKLDFVPAQYRQLFIDAGKTCPEISAEVLGAQAKIESVNFDPDVISGRRKSPAGAQGISQFMPATWKTWGKGSPYNPADAITAQARYMCALVKQVPGKTVTNALAAYNAGPNAVKRYGGVPPYKETTNYIRKINALVQH